MAKRGKVAHLREMVERYNKKTAIMAERWSKVRPVIAERWKAAMTRLLGTEPLSTFVDALKIGLETGEPKYRENIKGKGETLVKHYYEKLTGKVFS